MSIIDSTRHPAPTSSMKPTDLIQGMLDLLILRTLQLEPLHGWAVAQRIRQISNEVLQVQQGSLYPALHRLEAEGWVRADLGASERRRRQVPQPHRRRPRQLGRENRTGRASRRQSDSSSSA